MAQNRPTRPVYLVRDTRERDVAPHLPAELSARGFGLAVSQLNTADFLICERTAGEPAVLAAFERKTWADFARGEADLRSLNLGKMLRLRRRTGCQLYFLIEGPAFPSPKRKFGRIPCAHLVTLQTRLMVDHAVFVVPTATPEHTAHRLAGFVRAFAEPDPRAGSWAFVAAPATGGRAAPDPGPPDETEAPERAPAAEGPTPEAPTPETDEPEQGGGGASLVVPAELTVVIEKPENVAAALAWARLKGVSAAVGGELACRFSIADLASGRVTVEQIRQL
ncbi:MAG TPA: ERCC4 domain-containing protein, partial [Elusimicrobiota bacterium]|nr:ERCC4 domain-containing protein [Elusimicrobiota bacterium]